MMHKIRTEETMTSTTTKNITDIIEVMTTCKEALQISAKMYMKCSTYIKLGAVEIANNENSVIKRAIRFKEYDDLEQDMDHFQSKMLCMHQSIA